MDREDMLIEACKLGNLEEITRLVSDSPKMINIQDKRMGLTPLFYGVLSGNIPLVRYLLSQGADPNITNESGDSALHVAADNSEIEIARLLVQNHADVNSVNSEGETPLHQSCYRGDTSLSELLITSNARVNVQTFFSKQSPLHISVLGKHSNCISILLRAGADPFMVDVDRKTPISLAQERNLECLFEEAKFNLYCIPEISDEDILSSKPPTKRSVVNLATTPEEPDAEQGISRIPEDLLEFLDRHSLQECFGPLVNAGFESLDSVMKTVKSADPFSIKQLQRIGIDKMGTCAQLLVLLDENAGILDFMNFTPIVRPSTACWIVKKDVLVQSVESWLHSIEFDKYANAFRDSKYTDIEILFKQMQSRFPVNHFVLKEIGVISEEDRGIILRHLKKDSLLFLGKEILTERPKEEYTCRCKIF